MPLILTNVWEATKTVDRQYVELALSFRMNTFQIIRKIYIPTILPAFFSASRLAFGFGWRVSLVAETIGAGSGIGYRLRAGGGYGPERTGFCMDGAAVVISWY